MSIRASQLFLKDATRTNPPLLCVFVCVCVCLVFWARRASGGYEQGKEGVCESVCVHMHVGSMVFLSQVLVKAKRRSV